MSTNKKSSAHNTRSADDPLELVHAVMHQYRSRQYQALRDGPHGITHMQSKVLTFVGRHRDATQSDLARHSGRDKAQLARLIKGLREHGLLLGEADPADRRNVKLSLTKAGQAVLQALHQQSKRLAARAMTGLTAEQRHQLIALLLRLKNNLEADQ